MVICSWGRQMKGDTLCLPRTCGERCTTVYVLCGYIYVDVRFISFLLIDFSTSGWVWIFWFHSTEVCLYRLSHPVVWDHANTSFKSCPEVYSMSVHFRRHCPFWKLDLREDALRQRVQLLSNYSSGTLHEDASRRTDTEASEIAGKEDELTQVGYSLESINTFSLSQIHCVLNMWRCLLF